MKEFNHLLFYALVSRHMYDGTHPDGNEGSLSEALWNVTVHYDRHARQFAEFNAKKHDPTKLGEILFEGGTLVQYIEMLDEVGGLPLPCTPMTAKEIEATRGLSGAGRRDALKNIRTSRHIDGKTRITLSPGLDALKAMGEYAGYLDKPTIWQRIKGWFGA